MIFQPAEPKTKKKRRKEKRKRGQKTDFSTCCIFEPKRG